MIFEVRRTVDLIFDNQVEVDYMIIDGCRNMRECLNQIDILNKEAASPTSYRIKVKE